MGTTYVVVLLDEFDWEYVGKNKASAKKEFEEHIPSAEFKGEWYGGLVYDIDRTYPNGKVKEFLLNFADLVYYQADHSPVLERLE